MKILKNELLNKIVSERMMNNGVVEEVCLDLIPTAIECCRSPHLALQLAALRLFHGLSRSVHHLRTTFNDTICDILLEAIQSTDLEIVKISSCVISNCVLKFSTCQPVDPFALSLFG